MDLAYPRCFTQPFLINWYVHVPKSAGAMLTYFPLIHVAVGVGLTHYAIAGWMNRTRIYVGYLRITNPEGGGAQYGKKAIMVRHAPLPWLGNKQMPASDVKQLYTQEGTSYSRRGARKVNYEVRVVTQGGRNKKLVGGLTSREQAIFIEQEIEKYLNIVDTAVKGQS